MLHTLTIRNLAIIEEITVNFGPGLNILTGETGAGKSIVLAALALVLGGRSDRSLVRTGTQESWVEALFDWNQTCQPLLETAGIDVDPQEPLALRRIVQHNGRSRAYLNCVSVPAQLLRQLAPLLLDFGRQHDQSQLLDPQQHIDLLDRYAETLVLRNEVSAAYQTLAALHKEQQQLSENRHERQDRMDFLHFQREAITALDPQPGEVSKLEQELEQLRGVDKRKRILQRSAAQLDGDQDSLRDRLYDAMQPLESESEHDPDVDALYQELQNALYTLEEVSRSLHAHQRQLHADPQQIQTHQERLDQLHQLQDKYGGDLDAVFERLASIDEELAQLSQSQEREKELDAAIRTAQDTLSALALPLRQKRQEAAHTLEQKVEQEMSDLAMPGARLQVRFQDLTHRLGLPCPLVDPPVLTGGKASNDEAASSLVLDIQDEHTGFVEIEKELPSEDDTIIIGTLGAERVHFLLAANTGEAFHALEKVASGGELSRILLALKQVLAHAAKVDTFVFDEIDAGVAGAAATQIARKLRSMLSPEMQIICITHTPQIAAEADHHFHVCKQTVDDRTSSKVRELDMEERIDEVARMLAGDQSMEQALQLSRQLLAPSPLAKAS